MSWFESIETVATLEAICNVDPDERSQVKLSSSD